MINPRDNGYLKAQRQYDAQLPSSCEDEVSEDEEQSRREAYEDCLERKAEEAREEQSLEMPKYPHDIDINSDRYSGLGECRDNE